ncbi:hypothetical protein AYI68_g3377 [Smittium mucronatum]|uniref:Uncharacterized protein n=1 Tax=Smittium mucronatum TaxID=133383 RepID=A0A1R0H040_9FUNG|nr:hypothetical protein AYI68_g3377 [Smittium mucronatum]
MLDSFNMFFEELHRVFSNQNQVATAELQRRSLKKTNSDANYSSDFRRLIFKRVLEKFNRPRQSFGCTLLVQTATITDQPTSPKHQPMEIESTITRRPVLTPQERQRRRD